VSAIFLNLKWLGGRAVTSDAKRRHVPALRVNQWLASWDKIEFSDETHRRKPEPYFFLLSLPAVELRSLCGIARRQASKLTPRAADLGIQREHDPDRSEEIAQFVEYGYPWSTLSDARRRSDEFNDLRKPGWLPTAIVINVLKQDDERNESRVSSSDLIAIKSSGNSHQAILPYEKWSKEWVPSAVPPMEVIDGQHRLWAFGSNSDPSFEVPVVVFHGLDISWQAYLFWTINIKPKRINPSLAFDLYPLLRAEDWLDRGEGHAVYRETRSQELTEALWSHPESVWYDRINMLGERRIPWVSQSAWIKSLMATFVRPWKVRGDQHGGLFGSRLKEGDEVLGWSRAQQAAFLIYSWRQLFAAITDSGSQWAKSLRVVAQQEGDISRSSYPEFYGPYSLISTDQGVRGFMHVLNDLCFVAAPNLELRSWRVDRGGSASDASAVTLALKSLNRHTVATFVDGIAKGLSTFDWRASSTPELTEKERRDKLVFRGSSGYKEIRTQLLDHLKSRGGTVGKAADRLRALDNASE
jgi:hypothetical protein